MHYKKRITGLCLMLLCFFVLIYLKNNYTKNYLDNDSEGASNTLIDNSRMVVSVVVCGNRTSETLVMIKSLLILTHDFIDLYIFTDDQARKDLNDTLSHWQLKSRKNFAFQLFPVQFPHGEFQSEFHQLFKPCAAQRLFLPDILTDVNALLYVDTDILFLGPLNQIWNHFSLMNDSQSAALAPEHEDFQTGWYNRFAKHPFYKPLGVNTGVMLMNLTRLRSFGWKDYIVPIYKQYKSHIPWGDQDIINILFSYHPERLYIYGCHYNFRADHCMYTSVCKPAEKDGIIVLHGSRGIFHNNNHPTFRSVYKAIENYQWHQDPYEGFLVPLKNYVDSSPSSQCGGIKESFYKNVEKYIKPP